MKIAMVVGRFPVLSESFILNQITGLLDRGHQVDIYALDGLSQDSLRHPSVDQYQLLRRTYASRVVPANYWHRLWGAFIFLLTQGYRNPGLCLRALNVTCYGKRALSLRLLYGVMGLLDQPAYDVVHCQFGVYAMQGISPTDPGGLLLRDLGALRGKLVTTFRGFDISWYVSYYSDRVYAELFERGELFLANCEFFRQRAMALGCPPERIQVLRSGIDVKKFAFRPRTLPSEGKLRVVTVGRLVEKKGIEYGIRAIAALGAERSQLEYWIIGDGPLRSSLSALIETLNLGDTVQLLGWKNQAELITLLDQAHLLIAPSVTASNGDQDAPVNTLKEAMAMGLPVIATAHGGIPELVEDGVSGFLVPEQDAGAIAAKLRHLIQHPEIWPLLGQAGRHQVETQYEIETLNDTLVSLYHQLIGSQPE